MAATIQRARPFDHHGGSGNPVRRLGAASTHLVVGSINYLAIVAILKVSGARTLSQMKSVDFVIGDFQLKRRRLVWLTRSS
jgi:hypothetical protein